MKFNVGDLALFDPGYDGKPIVLCTIRAVSDEYYWPRFLEETDTREGGWCHFRFKQVTPLVELAKCAE